MTGQEDAGGGGVEFLMGRTGLCRMALEGIREKRAKEQSRGRKAFSNLPGKTLAHSRRRRFPLDTRNPIVEQRSGTSGQLFLSESLDPSASFP